MIKVCVYASMQVCKYVSMQVCKYAISMKVCKYARGHLVREQRGRLIGKGSLPKDKFMKALGEVSSHCEIFSLHISISCTPCEAINNISLKTVHPANQPQ